MVCPIWNWIQLGSIRSSFVFSMKLLTDPVFIASLKASERAVWLIAQALNERGFEIRKLPLAISPTQEERHDYADGGDLFFRNPYEDKWFRAEVKHRQLEFQPNKFPYSTVIVCEDYTWTRAVPKPDVFFMVNKSCSVVAIVSVSATKSHWVMTTRYDNRYKKNIRTWVCPSDLLRYWKI